MAHYTKRKAPKPRKVEEYTPPTDRELMKAMAVHCLLPVLADYMEDIPMVQNARKQAEFFIGSVRKNNDLIIGSNLNFADQQSLIQIEFVKWWENFYNENIKE